MGSLGKCYRDTTKILRPPSSPPQANNNDGCFTTFWYNILSESEQALEEKFKDINHFETAFLRTLRHCIIWHFMVTTPTRFVRIKETLFDDERSNL